MGWARFCLLACIRTSFADAGSAVSQSGEKCRPGPRAQRCEALIDELVAYCSLKGQKCLLTVEHVQKRDGSGVFAAIASLSPIPAGYGQPAPAPTLVSAAPQPRPQPMPQPLPVPIPAPAPVAPHGPAQATPSVERAEWKARDWFNEMEGCGWKDYAGRDIRRWDAVLQRVAVKWQADGSPTSPPVRTTEAHSRTPNRRAPVDWSKGFFGDQSPKPNPT